MNDLFAAAAARAQQKRSENRIDGEPVTLENNALVKLMREREAEAREDEERSKAWEQNVRAAFDVVIALANSLGRGVKEITYNGEVAFVVREGEAVRMYIGKIRDIRALQIAVARLMNCAMGC